MRSTRSENIAGDAGELDVRGFQKLEQAIALGSPALDKLAPISEKITKLSDGLGGTKLLAISPCLTKSAIHSLSFTSVL